MIVRAGLCTLIALTAFACTQRPPADVADVVILDAAMVTMDPAQPQASALAIRDGKIAFVGDNESAQKWVGEKLAWCAWQGRPFCLGSSTAISTQCRAHCRSIPAPLPMPSWRSRSCRDHS